MFSFVAEPKTWKDFLEEIAQLQTLFRSKDDADKKKACVAKGHFATILKAYTVSSIPLLHSNAEYFENRNKVHVLRPDPPLYDLKACGFDCIRDSKHETAHGLYARITQPLCKAIIENLSPWERKMYLKRKKEIVGAIKLYCPELKSPNFHLHNMDYLFQDIKSLATKNYCLHYVSVFQS